ncbi:Uncharacterised protein [Yersinia frederiksenii]|nr:Uncharacterised protein [Yersinia frederiksenii]
MFSPVNTLWQYKYAFNLKTSKPQNLKTSKPKIYGFDVEFLF